METQNAFNTRKMIWKSFVTIIQSQSRDDKEDDDEEEEEEEKDLRQ